MPNSLFQIESTVDKISKTLNDKRNEELKAKKLSHACARENERMQEQALESKANKGKLLTEKDIHKVFFYYHNWLVKFCLLFA